MTDALIETQILPQGPIGGDKRVKNRHGLSSENSAATEVDATKRRTEITIETQRLLVISRRRVSAVAWCRDCCWRVRMIGPEEAAIWSGMSSRTIYRWLEEKRLHFVERRNGLLLICVRSLSETLAEMETEKTQTSAQVN